MLLKSYIKVNILIFTLALMVACNKPVNVEYLNAYKQDSVEVFQKFKIYNDTFKADYKYAQTLLEEILNTISNSEFEYNLLAKLNVRLVMQETHAGNEDFVDSITQRAISLIPKGDSSRFAYDIYEARGLFFFETFQYDSAIYYYTQGEQYARACNFIMGVIIAKSNLAALYSDDVHIDKSIEYLEELIPICVEHDFDNLLAGIYNNLGNIYWRKNNLFTALKCYQKSLELNEKEGNEIGSFNPINNIALIYKSMGMDSLAEISFNKIIQKSIDTKNYRYYGLASINLAALYVKKSDYDLAIDIAKKGYWLPQNMGFHSSDGENHFYRLMAEIYFLKEMYDSTLYYAKKASMINLDEKCELVETGLQISNAFYELGQIDSSEHYANLMYSIAKEYGDEQNLAELLKTLAKINMKRGNFYIASKYYEEYGIMIENYIDTISSQQTKDIAYNFELQRKDKENILLEKDNELAEIKMKSDKQTIKSQKIILTLAVFLIISFTVLIIFIYIQLNRKKANNAILRDESIFKSHLLSIVTHDLRSPLISLHSMLSILKYEPMDDETRERLTAEVLAQTEKSIDLSDNLLFWTREQIKGAKIQFEDFKLKVLVDNIVYNEINDGKKDHIDFINFIDTNLTINNDKNIVHLVIRNLLSNAYKFTPEGGEIKVYEKVEDGKRVICVSDTGTGIADDHLNKILNASETISMKGVRGEKGKGFGLLLCKYFLQKCNGQIWFHSKPGEGSTSCFSIPV